jgi:tagaturonate reductase
VLQFGTGMLLRAVCAAAVDRANRAAAFNGLIVAVQSTPQGRATDINAQAGLFTLVERGLEQGAPVQRTRLIGSLSRALVADQQWQAVREVARRPELRVILSNVTETGFRLDGSERWSWPADRAPASFPAKLTDLLYTRFERLPDGPSLFVIPTELVARNGPLLAAMVEEAAARRELGDEFREWLARRVRFCSSLVDRITTGAPPPGERADLASRLGYADAILTVTEPHCLWAIETDSAPLHAAFPIDDPPSVVFAPDIEFYSQRKLRLLNGAHTALAPLAILLGVEAVRQAAEHPRLGEFLRAILFDEIVPATGLPLEAAESFAGTVLDRFRNPWIEHRWEVIATNQTIKLRLRVLPSIASFLAARARIPPGLTLACAAYLRYTRCVARVSDTEGRGWWRGGWYPIRDVALPILIGHWDAVDRQRAPGPVPPETLEQFASRVLADSSLWGMTLASLPGFVEAAIGGLRALEAGGVDAALDGVP